MIVLDASAAVDLLLSQPWAARIAQLVSQDEVHTVDLAFVEVVSTLRRWELRGDLSPARAEQAVKDLFDLPIESHGVEVLARRTWPLRSSVTTADAVYVLLARSLEAQLVTTDHRLARTAPRWCSVADLAST